MTDIMYGLKVKLRLISQNGEQRQNHTKYVVTVSQVFVWVL